MRRFSEALTAEPSVTAVVTQTAGGEGCDGFAIAPVKTL
jgi:hypothetical protein